MKNLVKACLYISSAVFISLATPMYNVHDIAMEEDTNKITTIPCTMPPQTATVAAIIVTGATDSAIKEYHTIKSHEIQKPKKKKENKLYYIKDESGCIYNLASVYQNYLWKMCKKYGIKKYYRLLLAQMYHESNFNINEISSTHDYGLMQINTCNFSWLRKKLGINDFLDPYDNIKAGTYMMSTYLKKYDNAHKALVCYNMGESKVKSGITSSQYSRGVIHDISLLKQRKRGVD